MKETRSCMEALCVHFSIDCNIACSYCYIRKNKPKMVEHNCLIREKLQSGEFIQGINNYYNTEELRDGVKMCGLWGGEPTINGDLFDKFFNEFLVYYPNCRDWMISTNALVGGEKIYNDFLEPIITYAEQKNTFMKFTLQFSLDGPEWINDKSRYKGATKNTLAALDYVVKRVIARNPKKFKLTLLIKPTLDMKYINLMNNDLSLLQEYFDFFEEVQYSVYNQTQQYPFFEFFPDVSPTLVNPGFHTSEDGKAYALWLDNLMNKLDTSKYGQPNRCLFPFFYGHFLRQTKHRDMIYVRPEAFSCSFADTNIMIDCLGNVYTCQRFAKNLGLEEEDRKRVTVLGQDNLADKNELDEASRMLGNFEYHEYVAARRQFMDSILVALIQAKQIDASWGKPERNEDRNMLFWMVNTLSCPGGTAEDLTGNILVFPTSYLKLFCNGAYEKLMEYATRCDLK